MTPIDANGGPSSSALWSPAHGNVMVSVAGMEANAWSHMYSSIPMASDFYIFQNQLNKVTDSAAYYGADIINLDGNTVSQGHDVSAEKFVDSMSELAKEKVSDASDTMMTAVKGLDQLVAVLNQLQTLLTSKEKTIVHIHLSAPEVHSCILNDDIDTNF